MGDKIREIESSSSSQDSDLILSSSGGSVFSQQNTSGNQSQNRRRHSLSLKKKHRENYHQLDENIETKSRPRQLLFSSMETPKTDSSTSINNNCELFKHHSTGQSIGNNTSFKPNITEHIANHSRSKNSKTADIFDICELNSSSQGSPSSSFISSQHEVAESELQAEHEHSVLSHEKRRREKRCRTEQHKEKSKGRRVRKDLFDSFGMSSSSSSDDMKIAETDLSCSQSHWSGNSANVRKTAKLSLVKSPQLTGSEKQDSCSSSTSDASRNTLEFKNLFDNFSHEKKILTDSYIEGTPKLQNQTKESKFATKAVKEISKQKSPEDAIVIDDSPDRSAHSHNLDVRLSASVRENTMHRETKPGALETVGANSHLIHRDRTLSKNEKEKQENVSCDFPSQKDSARPELSHRQASSSGSLSHILLEHLKQKQPTIRKLLTSKIVSASVKQNSKKELTEEALVIISDEETEEINESQVQLHHRGESGLSKKTQGLKTSESTSLSQKQNSSMDVNQSRKINKPIVADSLSSSTSCHSSVRKTFPALYNSFCGSSLSQEIPDQGTVDNQNNANRDSEIPRLAAVSSNTSVSSMPTLQKKPSSMYRHNSFEECSPPMLSQYPIPSPPTSLHLPEEVSHTDLPSPMKNDVSKSASEEVISSESSMFTECSVSSNNNPEDDLNGKLTDLIDMLDTAEDDQQVVGRTQPGRRNVSKIGELLQSGEVKSSETSHVSISSKSSTRQLHAEQLNTGTDLEVTKKEGCDIALRGKEMSSHYSDIDEEIYILDSDDDFMNESLQDTHCSNRQESESCMKDGGEDGSDVNKVDGQVLTAGNFSGRTTLNHPNENRVSLEHTSGSRKAGGLTVSEKNQDQNDLVVEHEPQIPIVCTNKQHCEQEPSTAADFCVTVAVSPGGSIQTSDAGIAAMKEEVDDNAFAGAADSSMYSEINDEVYILDSDDDEFFMTQSVLTNLSDKQEDEHNCTENKWRSALYEKDSPNLFEGKSDDKVTCNKRLNGNDMIVVKDVPGSSLADEIDDPTDFDGMDSSFDDLDQENPNTEKNQNDNNEPSEVNIDDMAKSTVDDDDDDDDDDDIFLSQIDDVDAYFAHTQIDYTTHSDDEVDCKDYVDVLKSSRAGSSPVTLDRFGKSSENISESSVSSCEGFDTQDPFTAVTQVGYPSETNDQNQYDVATLPVSNTGDEDTQIQVDGDEYEQIQVNNKMHTTLDFITKQNLCNKGTAIFKTIDQNLHEENEPAISPMLNADTQDPYSLETQHNSEVLMKEHHSLKQQLQVSHVGSVFTMEIQECFEVDDHDTDPYNKETLSISSSSEHSESVFTLLQTQISTEPEENDNNKKGREKDLDYVFARDDKLNLPRTEGTDNFKLARSDQCKSGFHTSCTSVNDHDTQDQSGITTKENDQLLSEEDDAYKGQTQAFPPGKMLESSHNIATLKNVQSESSDDQAAVALLFNDDDTLDQFEFTTQDDDHLLVSADEDIAYEGKTQVFSPATELQTSYSAATQKIVQLETTDYQADKALLNDNDRQDHFDIRTKDHDRLESDDDDDVYRGQTQQFSPGKELHNCDDRATVKNVHSESSDDQAALALFNDDDDTLDQFDFTGQDDDHLLESDEDSAYEGKTQVFSPARELQTSYSAATQKIGHSEATDYQADKALLNDNDRQDHFDIRTKDHDRLESDDDDDVYRGQTQQFSPGKELHNCDDRATVKNVQPEGDDYHLFDIQTLADSPLLNDADTQDEFGIRTKDNNQFESEDDDVYAAQTQFSPGKELHNSDDIPAVKNVQPEEDECHLFDIQTLADSPLLNDTDTQDQFGISTKDHDQLESEDDDVYGGQTQQFSPGNELQNSKDIATAKNVQPKVDDCHLYDIQTLADSPLLNDANTQDEFGIRTKGNNQLESEDDDVYGGQTQQFSPGNELQNSKDIATAKNVQPKVDDCHLYDIQTLADSPLLNDPTQDLFDDEVQEQPQLSSNEKYIYEKLTLANSSHEDSESVREKCCGLTSVRDVTEVVLNKETKRNHQAALEDIYDQQTLASSQRNKSDDFYNMPTQNNFQSDKNDHTLIVNERSAILLDEEDTQDPSDYDQDTFPLTSEAALEDRCLYEQQTLASSQRSENGDFYNIPTQNSFQLDKHDHTLSGNKMSITSLDEEDTQDPSDCETQAFHLASEDRYPCESEREILAACQDEESLYNKATQKMSQPERNSPSPYNRETLALSPTVGETYLHTAEKQEYSKSNHQYPTVGENLSPSSSVDTQDPFDVETNVSSLEDQDGETFAASSSLGRNIENNCLLQMKTDVSPVTEHSISNRETTAAATCSRRDDNSSNDSDCFFIMKTQKDSSLLTTDQDPYTLQTQAVSTSFIEDIHDPFSVETLIDSPPGLEIVSPFDRQTLDISLVSENSQDPFSAETEVDTSSSEERNSLGQVNALATTSCNKDAENNYDIETQTSMHHVQTLVPHDTMVVAHLSVIGNGSREGQIQSDLKTQMKSNDPLSAQGQSLQYSKNQIHEQLQSHTPEPFDDTVLPSKATKYNIEGNISTNIQDSNVHHLQISEKNSDNENVSTAKSLLRSIRNNSSATNLIKRLSFNISQKVHQPSEDVGNSSGQDVQSPYFVNCKQNSPTVKDANTTESCCLSSPTGDANNVSPSAERILQIPDAKGLSLQQDLTIQHCEEKTFGLSKSNFGSIKRPADHRTEASSKRKCITQSRDFHTEGSSGIAGRKRSTENKELNTHMPYSKRIKVVSAENTSSEHTWITARKGDSSGGKHKSTTVAKNTSKFKRPRSKKVKEVTKGSLTSQVELAKRALQNRTMVSRSVKPVNDQQSKSLMNDDDDVLMPSTQDMMNLALPIVSANLPVSKKHLASGLPSQGRLASDDKELQDKIVNDQKAKSLMNDDNEDVAMPSTQDMLKLGLPIVSANLPVSKKHLASGLPSQGRLASDDKELQDKNKNVSSGKPLNGFCYNKNSIQKDVLPSVPLFCPLAASRNISSSVESTDMPAHPAVSLETPASSMTSSTESKEPSLDQSLVKSNCHKDSGSIHDKLITQTHPAVILPVSSSSETSSAETVQTSSAMFIHANAVVPSQPGVSVVNSVPTLSSERVYSNGRGLPSLQGVLKQSTETISSHHGILKSSKSSEQNQRKKAAPKVTFVDLHRERLSTQRREATLPQAVVSQPRENAKSKPEAKLYFLSTLLHWNPVWLKEKEKIQSLPALFGSQHKIEDACCQLRIYYSTFHEYVDITLKLLILECWETIYRDWKMCSLRPAVTLDVYCTCRPRQPHKEKEGQSLVFIEVTGLATQQTRSSIPSVGDLLIMDFWGARRLEEKKYDEPRKFTQFAFVKSVAVQNVDIRQFVQTNPIFASSSALRDQKPLMVNMTLILQHRGAVIIPSNLHKVQVISSLKTMSRQIDALINLPESPLCMELLKPTSGGLFAYTSVKPDNHLLSKLNQEQACSVATIVQEVRGSPTSQRMFFLQGPPGTGKSHTILALIHQILIVTNFKGRICLAAPSNAAVDEMAKRIITFSKKLKSSALQGISLVRVGNKNRVHPAVKPFMLEDLVEEIINRDIPNSLKCELSALEETALKLERELSDKSLTQEKRVINSRKQKEIKTKIFKLKADMAPKKKNGRERYNARCNVLDNAQVICGTLNSLGSEDLQQIVLRTEENRHKKLPFTCLIIDEATQAIEVECLIPLQYKMTKVVLVGDPEQLPATVLSQMATEKQLARSLFERMDFYIRQCLKTSKSPVMMLTRQYRMHKEILNLPNSFFYDGQLVTDESVIARKELIAPYLVFDIQDSKESKDANTGSVSNKEEAICIAQLCEIVSKKIDKIGVICPYTDQQRSILGCLRDRKLAIEVNTVDSFQGQEREVIILSCVRAQSNPSSIGFLSDRKRMNVALTRARLALYVIGNFDTLKTDELWEQLYRNAMERNLLVKVQKTSDFKLLAENAVCRVNKYIANR